MECGDDLVLYTDPGALSQTLTNLIVNSLVHAYGSGADLEASGDVIINAVSNHAVDPKVTGVSLSTGAAVSTMNSTARIGGATRASIDGASSVTSTQPPPPGRQQASGAPQIRPPQVVPSP